MFFFVLLSVQRIEKVKTAAEGTLYGLINNDTIFLLGFSLGVTSLENNLPIGLTEVGRIKWNRIARPSAFDWTKVCTPLNELIQKLLIVLVDVDRMNL